MEERTPILRGSFDQFFRIPNHDALTNNTAQPLSGFQILTGVIAKIPDLFLKDARRCVSTQRPRNNMKPATRNKMRSNLEMDQAEIILYQFGDQSTMLEVRVEDETVWLNQAQLALH